VIGLYIKAERKRKSFINTLMDRTINIVINSNVIPGQYFITNYGIDKHPRWISCDIQLIRKHYIPHYISLVIRFYFSYTT
jgi:hypothetical protein